MAEPLDAEGVERSSVAELLRRQNRAWLLLGGGFLVALVTMMAAMWRVATGFWICAASVCRAAETPSAALIGVLVGAGAVVMVAGLTSLWRSRLV